MSLNSKFCVSTLTLAIASAFSISAYAEVTTITPNMAASTNYVTQADETKILGSDDTYYLQSSPQFPGAIFVNNGTLGNGQGKVQLSHQAKIENNGKIDVLTYESVAPTFGPESTRPDSAQILNKENGELVVRNGTLGLSLDNAGKVVSGTGSLQMTDRNLIVREGATFTKIDGTMLDEIVMTNTDKNVYPYWKAELDAGAKLEAKRITLAQTVNVTGKTGGEIVATESLTFSGNVNLKNATLATPDLTANLMTWLDGQTHLSGVKTLKVGSTFALADKSYFDDDYVKEVIFLARNDVGYAPRVNLSGEHSLHVGQLTVNKSTNNGNVIKSVLNDNMSAKGEGLVSFTIDDLIVKEGALLDIYADKKKTGDATDLKIGNMNLGEGAVVNLGLKSGSGEVSNFASKTIDSLTLNTNSVVNGVDEKSTQVATIRKIQFNGTGAKVTSSLTGASTDVFLKAGATGNTLSSVSTDKFNVTLEKTAKDSLHVTNTGDNTVVNVVAAPENNSGNAQKDLTEIAESVVFDDKKTHNITQQADDLNDSFSGTVTDGKLGDVKVEANANINGIAEMTALGLHIWRNEINDMNKRLGELRDSSADANGVWARVYNGKAKFGNQNITNKYTAFQFGYDHQVAAGTWLGGALSWTDGNNDFAVGGGDSSLLAFTGYGSKLWDNGMFLDVTGKVGRMKNEFDISLASGKSSASYHTNAVSVSAEAGWRLYPMQNSFYVEPQVELMYGHVFGVDYSTSTGVNVEQDSADTLIGRAGVVLGLKCPDNRGNAYLRASVLHDWKGDADFTFSKTAGAARTISEELGGTWYEYGIGANFNVTKQVHLYADVEAANGGEVDTDYRVNFGVRLSY